MGVCAPFALGPPRSPPHSCGGLRHFGATEPQASLVWISHLVWYDRGRRVGAESALAPTWLGARWSQTEQGPDAHATGTSMTSMRKRSLVV